MRVVLYSGIDGEPITVIELSREALRYLNSHNVVSIPVKNTEPQWVDDNTPIENRVKTVRILSRAVPCIPPFNKWSTVLFTYDEESALLLESAFLPGQQRALQLRDKAAFAKGFLAAMQRLGSD